MRTWGYPMRTRCDPVRARSHPINMGPMSNPNGNRRNRLIMIDFYCFYRRN
jgi:hypothetical protein